MILIAAQVGIGGVLGIILLVLLVGMALKPGADAGYKMSQKRNYRNSKTDNMVITKVVVHHDEKRKVQRHPWTPRMGTIRKVRVKDVDGYKVNDFMVLTGHSYYRTEVDPTDPTLEIKVLCTSNTIVDDYLAAGKDVDEIRDELL